MRRLELSEGAGEDDDVEDDNVEDDEQDEGDSVSPVSCKVPYLKAQVCTFHANRRKPSKLIDLLDVHEKYARVLPLSNAYVEISIKIHQV